MNPELYEKIFVPCDISLLQEEFIENTKSLPPVFNTKYFGGWSITSSDGSYKDGWIKQKPKTDVSSIDELNKINADELQFKGPQFYRQPTELCKGEVKKLVDYLDSMGFYPCRARYTVLRAGGETSFHQDYPSWLYGVRLHIPIITNPSCYFEYETEKAHLPADGSAVLLKINRVHRVYNHGSEDRIHFLCDFFDTKQLTKYNKFSEQDRANLKRKPT